MEIKDKKLSKFKKIIRYLYPTYIYENVESIPYELIKNDNIKLIILDMDNTLVDNKQIFSKQLKQWSINMQKNNIELYILSNCPYGKIVKKVAQKLKMKYQYNASKPFLKGFIKIMDTTKIQRENILMVGDQLFTDIFGGNRFGVKTILVRPINKKEVFITKLKRPFEKMILNHLYKKGEL